LLSGVEVLGDLGAEEDAFLYCSIHEKSLSGLRKAGMNGIALAAAIWLRKERR